MDVLSEILDHLRLRGTLYFTTEFGCPWGVRVPAHRRVARFHLVVRGACWVSVGDDAPVRLDTGDLVLVPHGAEHVIADPPDGRVRSVDDVIERSGFTGRGALVYGSPDAAAPTRLVCGHFEFDDRVDHLLLEQLPSLLVIPWETGVQGTPLEGLVSFIAREARAGLPGHEAVCRRLSEVLFIQAVRFWARSNAMDATETPGVLAALGDPRLAGSLAAIHENPAGRWTLDRLAHRAALGRTAFAARFRDVVGTTPHAYLTQWRIQVGRRLLLESRMPLQVIALRVGYDSSASFSRAFRKVMGTSPGAYRSAASKESGAAD